MALAGRYMVRTLFVLFGLTVFAGAAAAKGSFWLTVVREDGAHAREYRTGTTYLTGCSLARVQYLSVGSTIWAPGVLFVIRMEGDSAHLQELFVAEGQLELEQDLEASLKNAHGSVERTVLRDNVQDMVVRVGADVEPNAAGVTEVTIGLTGKFTRIAADEQGNISDCPDRGDGGKGDAG